VSGDLPPFPLYLHTASRRPTRCNDTFKNGANMYPYDMAANSKRRVAHMTFSIPETTKRRAQARRDVNWSAVVAQTIEERLKALDLMDRVLGASQLTEKDVDELADVLDSAVAKRHGLAR
jgi:hypothetical protein